MFLTEGGNSEIIFHNYLYCRYYFNRTLFDQLDPWFQKLLWNFASMANVINPFLYAMFDYGPDLVGCR